MGMQITKSLAYVTMFSPLVHLALSCGFEWDTVSMFYLGRLAGALGQAFKIGLLESMPTLTFSVEGN